MELRNHTAFPAIGFEGIDQHGQAFHVFVIRQTWQICGNKLVVAEDQAPLCEVDTFFGDMNQSSLRQESDLCHFKPRCDVILNGSAFAPHGQPNTQWPVRLLMRQPDTKQPEPAYPQGLNPMMPPSEARIAAWQKEVEEARNHPLRGKVLLDKSLLVTGPRWFRRKSPVRALAGNAIKLGSLGLLKHQRWQLSEADAIVQLPLRYEYAYGGQSRINQGDAAAQRLGAAYHLTQSQKSVHPDAHLLAPQQALAHVAWGGNPVGRGYALAAHLKADGRTKLAAPQIETPGKGVTAAFFEQACACAPEHQYRIDAGDPAGFGIRPKAHPARRALAGTIDQAFIDGEQWLPPDFDFAVWNAAPPDQQIDYPKGNEIIELINLCAPGTEGALIDGAGNTRLTLTLPGRVCKMLVRMQNGTMFFQPMRLDTLTIEPDQKTVSMVWRSILGKDERIRAVDLRLNNQDDDWFMARITEAAQALPPLQIPTTEVQYG